MSEKKFKDLDERLAIALTSKEAKDTAVSSFGLSFQRTIFADSNAISTGDGSSARPFRSLQLAINKIESFSARDRVLILVSSGSAFDEDIVIPGGRMLSILGLGAWNIGDAAGSNFASTTARNVTWTINEDDPSDFWHTLVLGTLVDGEASTTHAANASSLEISGDFLINGSNTTGVSLNLFLKNTKIKGTVSSHATMGKAVQLYIRKCLMDETFNMPIGQLNICESTQFDGLLTIDKYCRMWQCEIKSGMTVTTAPSENLPPTGMLMSTFKGTYTGPINSLVLDSITNYYFNANGAALAGGATRVLLHDETV